MAIHVPQICGESVDLKKDDYTMVIGSGELGQGIQIWDLRKPQKVKTVDWKLNKKEDRNPAITYCAFNKGDSNLIVACATDDSPAKGFYMQRDTYLTRSTINFKGIRGTCLTADMSNEGDMAAFGDSEGNLHVKCLDFAYATY